MVGRSALGAVIGSSVGLALIGLLILVPRARQDSFYEVGDALVVLGIPLLVIPTAAGAMIGVARASNPGNGTPSPASRGLAVTIVAVCLVGCVAAMGLFLWGTGQLA